jgi:hypothetical protein
VHWIEHVCPPIAEAVSGYVDVALRALSVDPTQALPTLPPRAPMAPAQRLRLAKAQLDHERNADLVAVGPRDSRLRRWFETQQALERAK